MSYDRKLTVTSTSVSSTDASGAPELITIEDVVQISECTITVGEETYTYPEDFDITLTRHVEYNAVTAYALSRVHSVVTFNLPDKPTIEDWGVNRNYNLYINPDGTVSNPEDYRSEGQFQLGGTGRFNQVSGFGLGDVSFVPPEYENTRIHNFGFVIGWPL